MSPCHLCHRCTVLEVFADERTAVVRFDLVRPTRTLEITHNHPWPPRYSGFGSSFLVNPVLETITWQIVTLPITPPLVGGDGVAFTASRPPRCARANAGFDNMLGFSVGCGAKLSNRYRSMMRYIALNQLFIEKGP